MATVGHKGKGRYRSGASPKPLTKRVERLLLLLLAGFFIYVLIGGDYGLYRIFRQMRLRSQLQARIEQLRKEQEGLRAEKRRLTEDLGYIERKAHEDYGMVKEGEWVYRVVIGED